MNKLIKVIEADNAEEFETKLNAFQKVQSCYATQTHVNQIMTHEGSILRYTAVVYYSEVLL